MLDAHPQILVIDDDISVQRLVSAVLKKDGYRVHTARGGHEALEKCAAFTPDLLILDLSLPGISGLDLLRDLRYWYRNPIVVLSGFEEEKTIVDALDLGADDYLTKPFRTGELLARIRAQLRVHREHRPDPVCLEAGDLVIDFAKRRVLRGEEVIRLTRTEFQILAYLVRNGDRVLTSEMILEEVWGPHHGDYAQTLRVHIGHIRKKIEPDPNLPRYILTEPGVGYRFEAPPLTEEAGQTR